jgi:O-antigen/teichoic acid export membrane protein
MSVFHLGSLRSRIIPAISLVRLQPFSDATSEGRAKERYRRIILAGAGSVLANLAATASMLIIIPMMLRHLGPERYGLWLAISSFLGLLNFADLGLGNGLINAIAAACGQNDRYAQTKSVSSAGMLLGVLSATSILGFAIAYPWVPWQKLFNLSSSIAVTEAGPAMAALFACMAIQIPLGVVVKARLGCQDGFANSLWTTLGHALGLLAVVAITQFGFGLTVLVLAYYIPPILATAFNGLHLMRVRPWLRPVASAVCRRTAIGLLRLGSVFFVLQITTAVIYWSDNLIIANTVGPNSVAEYAVPMRLFSIPQLIISVLLTPIWPAYGDAIARRDMRWVKTTLLWSVLASFVLSLSASAALLLMDKAIFRLWLGDQLSPPKSLMFLMATWCVLSAVGSSVAMFLNGAHIVRLQIVTSVLMAPCKIALSFTLAPILGPSGVLIGTLVPYALFNLLPYAIVVPRLLAALASPQPTPAQSPARKPSAVSAASIRSSNGVSELGIGSRSRGRIAPQLAR